MVAIVSEASIVAQEPDISRPKYFNIKDLNFISENQLPRTMIISGQTLRDTIHKVVENENWSCWIDSEIDATRRVEIHSTQNTTTGALQQLAQKTGLGIIRIDTVVYVSQPDRIPLVATAAALRKLELRSKLVRWPAHRQHAWKSRHNLAWENLTTLSELAAKAEKLWDVRIEGEIPHDLLPAGQLSNVLLADVLSLIASNSSQTFEVSSSGESARFRPLQPEDLTIQVHFPDTPREKLLVLAGEVPQVKIVDQQPIAIVAGTEPVLRQLYWLSRSKPEASITSTKPVNSRPPDGLTTTVEQGISAGKKSPKKKAPDDQSGLDPAKLKITLKPTQATRLAVLEQLARSGMTIEYNEKDFIAQGLPLDQKIEVVAENIPLDDFVKSLFPAGKVFIRADAKKLILSPVIAQP